MYQSRHAAPRQGGSVVGVPAMPGSPAGWDPAAPNPACPGVAGASAVAVKTTGGTGGFPTWVTAYRAGACAVTVVAPVATP